MTSLLPGGLPKGPFDKQTHYSAYPYPTPFCESVGWNVERITTHLSFQSWTCGSASLFGNLWEFSVTVGMKQINKPNLVKCNEANITHFIHWLMQRLAESHHYKQVTGLPPSVSVWNLQFSPPGMSNFSPNTPVSKPQIFLKLPCDRFTGAISKRNVQKLRTDLIWTVSASWVSLEDDSVINQSILWRKGLMKTHRSCLQILLEAPSSASLFWHRLGPPYEQCPQWAPGKQDHAVAIICAQTANSFWVCSSRVFLDSLWLQLHPPPQCFHFVPHMLSMI